MDLHKEQSNHQKKQKEQKASSFRRYRSTNILDYYRDRCTFAEPPWSRARDSAPSAAIIVRASNALTAAHSIIIISAKTVLPL